MYCPDVLYDEAGKCTWIVDLDTMQLLLNLQFASAKTDGNNTPINSFTKIKDPRSVYSDTDGKLLLRVDGTQQLDKVIDSSQNDGTTTLSCEVCHKFQGDFKAMRQNISGHDQQSTEDWFQLYQVLKPEFPSMLCGIRDSHGTNPEKDTSTMQGCYMWFESQGSQPTHYCILVQETKPYWSLVSANKSRWKSRGWKDFRTPEPSSNVPIRCPGCKEVFWKRYLHKDFSPKHANLTMTSTTISSIAM